MSAVEEHAHPVEADAPADTSVDGTPLRLAPDELARPLAEVLRAHGHDAVKVGCGEGSCGACTVQLDGTPAVACVLPAARAVGRRVTTAQGLVRTEAGASLATELARRSGLQCGFCVPGLLASGAATVAAVHAEAERADNRPPPGAETRGALDSAYHAPGTLDGHVCRCTGYQGLLTAVDRAANRTGTGTPERLGGWERASGATRYAADDLPAGTLSGHLLTSRSVGVRVRVRPGTAMQVPGAQAVLGPDDAPGGLFSTNPHVDDPVLAPAEEPVFAAEPRWVGDVVGIVVADTPAAARAMAARVEVLEEPLAGGTAAPRPGFMHAVGASEADLDAALATAASVRRTVHTFGGGTHGALEPPTAWASWDDDALRLRSTSQTPGVVAARLSTLFGREVVVEPGPLGGGFGLKEEVWLEPAAAVASRHVGVPVLVRPTLAQLALLRRRHAGRIEVVTGCAADGTVLARGVRAELDAGGALGHTALVLENVLALSLQTHRVPVQRADGVATLTATVPTSAFRGYGATELFFALDTHLDELAEAHGVDPVEYRLRHAARAGDVTPLEPVPLASFAGPHVLAEAGRQRRHRVLDGDERWRRGRGVAFFGIVGAATTPTHHDSAEAAVHVDAEGRFVVETAVPEMGTGLHTTLTGVIAERLGVPQARVRVAHLPPGEAPADEGAFATRGIYLTANAVAAAADAVRDELVRTAAADFSPNGMVVGTQVVSFARYAGTRGTGRAVARDNGLVAGAQLVDVAVDVRTGRVVVERVASVHDVGRVLDPDLARNQVLGGVVQGIGTALTERFLDHRGEPVVRHLDQGVPTAHTAPEVADLYVGDGLAQGLLAAKGLGEAPVVGIPAAVANAVHDAVGIRLRSLPMDPESVLAALEEAGSFTA